MNRSVGNVRYWVFGEAPLPWLIVTHGMALDHREFVPLAGQLAHRWRVVLWDMPGHGESQPQPSDFSAEAMADALESVLVDAGIEQAAHLGFSFGGVVAQIFVRRHPEHVSALILHGCFMPYLQQPAMPGWCVAPVLALMYGTKPWATIRDEFVRRCAISDAGQRIIATAPDAIGKRGFMAMTRALLRANQPDPTFRVNCPLLMLRGKHDGYAAAINTGFAALATTSPQGERSVIADAGHCAHVDAPQSFGACVTRFLDGVAP